LVGSGEDYRRVGEYDIFLRGANQTLQLWEFNSSFGVTFSGVFFLGGSPFTIDANTTVVGGGEDTRVTGQRDLFLRGSDQTLQLWEFNSASQVTFSGVFLLGGEPLTIDSGTSVIGGGEDYRDTGQRDFFLRGSDGTLQLWEFNSGYQITFSGVFFSNSVPLTINPGTMVVGGGQDYRQSGGHDLFLRGSDGALQLWEFNSGAQATYSAVFFGNGN
jgi:hypothetical protein